MQRPITNAVTVGIATFTESVADIASVGSTIDLQCNTIDLCAKMCVVGAAIGKDFMKIIVIINTFVGSETEFCHECGNGGGSGAQLCTSRRHCRLCRRRTHADVSHARVSYARRTHTLNIAAHRIIVACIFGAKSGGGGGGGIILLLIWRVGGAAEALP